MKKMMILLSVVAAMASVSAFASPSPSDSWDVIRSSPGVYVMPATAYDSNFGADGIFNACVDGDVLRNIKPVETCTNFVRDHEGPGGRDTTTGHCANYADSNVSVPIGQQVETCVSWIRRDRDDQHSCNQYETTTYSIPLSYNLEVKAVKMPWGNTVTLFSKAYTIPACNQ